MKIHNIRYGFATNSSSSHSVVLAPGLKDQSTPDELGYGWENFILASEEEKRKYLYTAAVLQYRQEMSEQEAAVLAGAAFKMSDQFVSIAGGDGACEYTSCYIDHDSVPSFPSPRNKNDGMFPLWEFLDREIAQQNKVAILGGNDNQDNEAWKPRMAKYAPELAAWHDITNSGGVYTLDQSTGHLTLFCPGSGKKVRIQPDNAPAPQVASVPELVDVKITDFCPVGCTYCYQGSTVKGKHAALKEIKDFARYIGNMGVFEVAIGGGDPTTHPDFIEILKAFDRHGVTPNFSTQMWDWLQKDDVVAAVREHCGAVAISTQSPKQAEKFIQICKDKGIKPHIHYVLGLSPLDNLRDMLNLKVDGFYGHHIVLLAYKEMGRAEGTPPIDYTGWQNVVRQAANNYQWTIAVDSYRTADVESGFSREEIPDVLFENGDGRFSLYWDAVEGSYAAHSFKPQNERIHYGEKSADKVAEAWKRISGAPKVASIYGK